MTAPPTTNLPPTLQSSALLPSALPAAGPALGQRVHGSISRVRIERVTSRVAAIFALLYVLQCLPAVFESGRYLSPLGSIGIPIAIYGSTLAAAVAAVVTRAVRLTAGIQAGTFLLALILWPMTVRDVGAMGAQSPWLWYVITLGMALAVISFPVFVAGLYIAGAPVLFALLRVRPQGGGAPWGIAALDAVYVLILGAFALILITTLRMAADRVDAAHLDAAQRYAIAIRSEARETQWARIDAILHDQVLATLLVAGKSETAMERFLSVGMAEEALETLQSSGSLGAGLRSITLADIREQLELTAAVLPPEFLFADQSDLSQRIPGPVAEAVLAGVTQAMVNSMQHAGSGRRPGGSAVAGAREPIRTVSIHAPGGNGFTIDVADTGRGFDVAAVSAERLGLRVSIRERIAAVGGNVAVNSIPGAGTSIVIAWSESSAWQEPRA